MEIIMENCTNKREKILNISFEFFLARGYEATTIRMICKKANVEPPTLYYYFGSKKKLFFAVVEQILKDYIDTKNESQIANNIDSRISLMQIYVFSINYAIKHTSNIKFYFRYKLFIPSELVKDIETFMVKTYDNKKQLYKSCICKIRDEGLLINNVEITCQMFERLVDETTFSIIFSDWRPSDEEIYDRFNNFWKLNIKVER